ncbi:MAG: primase alpha helix C-terminal domain-containing protein, partial [Actinomycetota bacterium]
MKNPLPAIISEGARNKWMTSLAGTIRRYGTSEAAILAGLRVENEKRCRPPLDEAELQ